LNGSAPRVPQGRKVLLYNVYSVNSGGNYGHVVIVTSIVGNTIKYSARNGTHTDNGNLMSDYKGGDAKDNTIVNAIVKTSACKI
jgi:hypothetical protein